MDSSLHKIKQLIKNKIGLDSSTIGDTTIENIILQRMHQCDLSEFKDYLLRINQSPQELNELLEITIIPETWFFRDIRPYEFIYLNIQKKISANKSAQFKILSLPCSTGEEPYSLAMYLIDKGITESAFSIDAVDVSQRALKHAKKGVYGNNSFRGKHYPLYQKKYFIEESSGYTIRKNIVEKINFYAFNILHDLSTIKYQFDFILCRNLLIYFDIETKLIAFKRLQALVKDDGYLFIGHSEFGSVPDGIFQNSGFEQAFALIKHSHPDFKQKIQNQQTEKSSSTKKQSEATPLNSPPNFESLIKKISVASASHTSPDNISSLHEIKKLTDSLAFDRAEEKCQLHINNHGEDSSVLYFLGLIYSSQNNDGDAESYFRKSLFLNPEHYESLIHLSLILEKNGDFKNSSLLKKRADKSFEKHKNIK